jgi:hypothetical protein
MFQKRPGKSEADEASSYSRRSAVADTAWVAQDRVRDNLDRAAFPIEKKVVWRLQDRAHQMGSPARALATGAVVLLAAGAGVAGLIWAAPDRPDNDGTAAVAAVAPAAAEAKAVVKPAAEPTLHGAAPAFKPAAGQGSSELDPAKAVVKSFPAGDPATTSGAASNAAAPTATSADAASSSTAPQPAGKANAVNGPRAGPAAVAVARDFSDAFVVYETGGLDANVRHAFGATATPELSRALLRRPPRLPANIEVPQAKVLNVVAGPSHAGVYAVSVSLLRVGVTSELRLDMEQLKGKEWRVTNVLG